MGNRADTDSRDPSEMGLLNLRFFNSRHPAVSHPPARALSNPLHRPWPTTRPRIGGVLCANAAMAANRMQFEFGPLGTNH